MVFSFSNNASTSLFSETIAEPSNVRKIEKLYCKFLKQSSGLPERVLSFYSEKLRDTISRPHQNNI